MSIERVTRSKASRNPKPLNPEKEPESESHSEDDEALYYSVLNPGRIQQPNVYVLSNLMAVKTEVHYNPIIAPKKEEGEDEVISDTDNHGDEDKRKSGGQKIPPGLIKVERTSPSMDSPYSDEILVEIAANKFQDLSSPVDKLLTSQSFDTLNYDEFVSILRKGRAQGKYSEEVLCEAAANWLAFWSKKISLYLQELVQEFPAREHTFRIIETVFEAQHPKQNLAFDLLKKVCMNESKTKADTSDRNDEFFTNSNASSSSSIPNYEIESDVSRLKGSLSSSASDQQSSFSSGTKTKTDSLNLTSVCDPSKIMASVSTQYPAQQQLTNICGRSQCIELQKSHVTRNVLSKDLKSFTEAEEERETMASLMVDTTEATRPKKKRHRSAIGEALRKMSKRRRNKYKKDVREGKILPLGAKGAN